MPYDKKPGAAVRMYDKKGKPAGLMLEGSLAYMESLNPDLKYGGDVIDQTAQKNEGSMATMDHGDSAAKFTGMSGGSAMHNEDLGKSKKMKDLPLRSRARYEEYRKRGWKQDETSLGKEDADNKIDLRDWQETGKSEDIQRRMPRR
jgi:hypothetical protein